MKNIKIAIALLTLLALLAACSAFNEPFLPKNQNVHGDEIAIINVSIGGGRTILPEFYLQEFSKFELSAEPADGNPHTAPEPVEMSGDYGQIGVYYGEWIITVTGYMEQGGVEYAVAKGSVPFSAWGERNNEGNIFWLGVPLNAPVSGGTGTFAWNVAYPPAASAQITLEPFSNGTAVINNETVSGGGSQSVPSGIYLLTVSAEGSGKTVIRNEIVHIYPGKTSRADYVFTKLDFGETLTLSGTIKVTVNGEQPDDAYLAYMDAFSNIDFSGSDGSGTWSMEISNLQGANTIEGFWISAYYNRLPFEKYVVVNNIPIPVDDTAGIDLGTVEFPVTPFDSDVWKNGEIFDPNAADWYQFDVVQDETYYIWWNRKYNGDDSKTAEITVTIYYADGTDIGNGYRAWDDPFSFSANSSGAVYLKVDIYGGNTGTYAIAYSTGSNWWNNNFDPVDVITLDPDEWEDGEILTGYNWYQFDVSEGQTYYFWSNDAWEGDDTKTAQIEFYIWDENGVLLHIGSRNWYNSASFTARSTDTYYLRVRAFDGWGETGSYGIAYSENDTRPD